MSGKEGTVSSGSLPSPATSPPLALDRLAVIDLETNGFSRAKDDIIELAVVHVEGPTLVLETLLKPRRRIGNREVHGITNRDIRHAPSFPEIAGHLLDVLVGRTVVAHNASFDIPFLERSLAEAGMAVALPSLCTLELHSALFGQRRDLEQACADLGVPFSRERHRAAADALATAHLLRAQLERVAAHQGPRPAFLDALRPPITDAFARTASGRASLHPRTQRSSS